MRKNAMLRIMDPIERDCEDLGLKDSSEIKEQAHEYNTYLPSGNEPCYPVDNIIPATNKFTLVGTGGLFNLGLAQYIRNQRSSDIPTIVIIDCNPLIIKFWDTLKKVIAKCDNEQDFHKYLRSEDFDTNDVEKTSLVAHLLFLCEIYKFEDLKQTVLEVQTYLNDWSNQDLLRIVKANADSRKSAIYVYLSNIIPYHHCLAMEDLSHADISKIGSNIKYLQAEQVYNTTYNKFTQAPTDWVVINKRDAREIQMAKYKRLSDLGAAGAQAKLFPYCKLLDPRSLLRDILFQLIEIGASRSAIAREVLIAQFMLVKEIEQDILDSNPELARAKCLLADTPLSKLSN